LPVYKKYNGKAFYASISQADRSPELDYIATVHHGIDLDLFDVQPDHGEYLLFFGRIHHDKGAAESIRIAKETGMKIVMAGIIQDREYYETQVKPYIDNDRVVYVGSVGPEKRNGLLSGAYALLHPINFDEPFGLSVIEAMACGTPVIAVNRGSMPEIIDDGVTGFLVSDWRDMAARVPKVKQLDRQRCRQRVEERFRAARMVDDYIQVYQAIMEKTGNGAKNRIIKGARS
jgi:glycosyltransferase involved in cell wall biosynthesis